MQARDELKVMVEAEVARAVENLKKFDASVDGAERTTKSLGTTIDSIAKKSMVMSGVIIGAGGAAVKFAGENEKLKRSLTNMLGSAEEASAVFEDWRRLGASPGLSVDEVFALGRAMVSMGHDTQYATATIEMLGNAAAGTGGSFGALSGTFEHVRAQGKLTARDLASLQQQGIPVLKQLAKELNTSEEGVRRLAAAGKLGFADLERAFRSMAGPGGQFSGMMEALSNTTLEKFNTAMDDAKMAMASFGEVMLPMATDLLDGASSVLRGITDMDEGAKRFVVGMGGMVAVSGPAIAAIKGIGAALKFAAANPYMLAIGGVITAAGVVAGIVNKQAYAYEDLQKKIKQTDEASRILLTTYAKGNNEKILDEKTTRELIKLYPELSKAIKANATTVDEAMAAQREANAQKAIGAERKRIEELKRYQGELAKINLSIREMENAREYYSAEHLEQYNKELANEIDRQQAYLNKIYAMQNEINKALAPFGKKYTLADDFMNIPITVSVTVDESSLENVPSAAAKKRWQDWYGEITGVDPARIGELGSTAADLYLGEFSRSFEAGKDVFAALGEDFDIAGALRGQQADIQKALIELLSIDPGNIDKPFELINGAMKPLIAEYRRLGVEIENADKAMKASAAQKDYAQKIAELQKKLDDFGKSESQIAYETAIADGALEKQAAQVKGLMDAFSRKETMAEYQRQIDEIDKSQKELAIATYAAQGATEDQIAAFKELLDLREAKLQAAELKETLEGIRDSLIELGAGSALSGIEELGKAFGQGANAGDAMKNALAAMHLEILNALPNLFLQAGLQLIAQGQWPIGLGFIAAAGTMSLAKGFVNGRIEDAQAAAQANAHGNAFDAAGIQAFARGGTFTNQVVTNPTLFKFAKGAAQGTGLIGEAGPEAIMPLKRLANGDLGVQTASGGAPQVVVNVINNSNAEVTREEYNTPDGGRQIDLYIGEMVGAQIAGGRHNAALESQFEGLRRRGR